MAPWDGSFIKTELCAGLRQAQMPRTRARPLERAEPKVRPGFASGHRQNKDLEQVDDSKERHLALVRQLDKSLIWASLKVSESATGKSDDGVDDQ
jgi:hypothetical protein